MKNGMAILVCVLACCLFVPAQSNMSGDSMKKDKAVNDDGGKTTSMTGCIAEKDGKYMMMNKAHPDGVQLMSSEDLKPHVGHKVQVKGIMEKMDSMSGDSMKSDDKMKSDSKMNDDKMAKEDKMKHGDTGMMTMKVSNMKMMSETCDTSKMMGK